MTSTELVAAEISTRPISRVLVVEDDPVAALLLTAIVEGLGTDVTRVATGIEALEATDAERFDLVLLDLGLPDIDGYEVAARLRERYTAEQLPIVFVSGEQDATARVEAFAAGGTDFVTKPYDHAEVRARVLHQLETRRLRRELEDAAAVLEERVAMRTVELSQRMTELAAEIERRRQLEAELQHLADTDPLTDLLNQRGFPGALDAWRRRSRPGRSVVAVDVDGWESVVGALGNRRGDELLRVLADRIRSDVDGAPVGRLGASLFVVGLDNGGTDATTAVERLRRTLEGPIGRRRMRLSYTIGAVEDLDPTVCTENLSREAMLALHTAKRRPGSSVLLDGPARDDLAADLALEQDLWGATGRREFRLQYQPLFAGQTLQVESLEALIRWHHPTRGMVSPAHFIPLAERCGAIEEIGDWTLSEALASLARWRSSGALGGNVSVAVNLSAVQAIDVTLPGRVVAALDTAGLPSSSLELELTETAVLQQIHVAGEVLGRLREVGVGVCLDDFGTGSSSLTLLRAIPADIVKLDRSFVARVADDADSRSIVESTMDLARRLGKRVVAEGIETEAQLAILRGMQCDLLQGYLLSRPVDAADVPATVATEQPWA